MPFSPEQMPQKSLTPVEETARLKEKIQEAEEKYGRIRPHLAISWPLTQLRKEAFQMVQTGEVNKEVRSHLEHHESPIERILWEKIADTIKEREPIAKTNTQREKMLRLLASKNPAFASLETEVLMSRLRTIEDIVKKLQKSFGDNFIGVTVYGSTAKGHMVKESDLDFTVIAYDNKVREKFQKMLWENEIEACPNFDKYLELSQDIKSGPVSQKLSHFKFLKFKIHESKKHTGQSKFPITGHRDFPITETRDVLTDELNVVELVPIFSGLFFGNHNALHKLQLFIMEKINPSLWDNIRFNIRGNALNLRKTEERFGLTHNEIEKMQAEIAVLRTPPPYEEALEFIRDKVGKLKKNDIK